MDDTNYTDDPRPQSPDAAGQPNSSPAAEGPASAMPPFLTPSGLEDGSLGGDPKPLPAGFEVIDGGASDETQVEFIHMDTLDPLAAAQAPVQEPVATTAQNPVQQPIETISAAVPKGVIDPDNVLDPEVEPQEPEGPSAAAVVGAFISEGVGSMREFKAARKAHADAREDLEQLQNLIADQQAELEHRRDIIARHPQIIAQETERKNRALAAAEEAKAQQEAHAARTQELKAKLQQMRDEDNQTEKRLKAAVEAAEAKEASSRESGSRLQRRLDDAKRSLKRAEKERDSAIEAAEKAVASAESRLSTLREEFAEVQRNPSVNPAAYSVRSEELQLEISDAAEQLRQATDALPAIRKEVEDNVEIAKQVIVEATKPIDAAKQAHAAVTDEADEARDALDTAKKDASDRQRALRDQISAADKEQREQERIEQDARDEAEAAQAVMDEANEIAANPQIVESIDADLARNLAELDEAQQGVAELADIERAVRDRTRSQRVRFLAALAGVIVLIAAIVAMWLWLT